MANENLDDGENLDDVVTHILTDNNAQGVLNHLKPLMANKARVRTRWVWELLQNARDAGADVVSVQQDEDKVVFRHNGAGFTSKEIAHLIYHGSTKTEDSETIGQYGSGFLTMHLLSPIIRVSGRLENGRRFKFWLKRELSSDPSEAVKRLSEAMKQSWSDFKSSLASSSESDDTHTEFICPINNDDSGAVGAVKAGIAMLTLCAPFVVVFNREFSSIEVESRSERRAGRCRGWAGWTPARRGPPGPRGC